METPNISTPMTKLAVTQRCCEWMALMNIVGSFVMLPTAAMMEIVTRGELDDLDTATTKMAESWTNGPACNTSYCVLLSENEVAVLAKLVSGFDDVLMAHSEELLRKAPEAFAWKYEQMGLLKRNLKLYAKPHTNSEKKHNGDDATHDTETGGGAGQ